MSQELNSRRSIDNALEKHGRRKLILTKNITDSLMLFFFTDRETNQLFRVTTYRNLKDTTVNYLYLDNSLVRIDIKRKRSYALYYFSKEKLLEKVERNISASDVSTLKKKGDMYLTDNRDQQ